MLIQLIKIIKKNTFTVVAIIICASNIHAQTIDPNGLKIWLKSDTGVILQTGKVVSWNDVSGNNNHCSQPDTSMAPMLNSNIASIGNRSSLLLDGIDDYMYFTNGINDIRTLFFVIKKNGSNAPFEPILGDGSNYDFIGTASGPEIFSDQYASSNIKNGIVRINTIAAASPTAALKPTNYSIITITTSGNVSASQLTRDRAIVDRVWKGEYSEVIIYNRILSANGIDSIENYLINKYSPSVSLGPDIPISPIAGCVPSTSINITANPDFQSYLWSNGDTSNQTVVTQYGEYSVICTDIFGKQHFDTIMVVPTPKNFNYPSNILCQNSSLTWDTQLNKSLYTFTWQNFSTDSLFVISLPGQYFVKVTDTLGCIYNSDTLNVYQDNFANNISLGPDKPLCSGNFITLTSGANPSLTYSWNTGSTNDSLLITNAGQYSVIVTNTNNCVAKDTIVVSIQGFAPTANFTSNIGCVNQIVSFTDLSIPPSGNTISDYEWSFGDTASPTNTSTAANPSHTYTNTGTYTVNLTVTTNSNCEQSITKIINVYPVPTAAFAIGTSCQNDSTAFLNQSTGITGYSITNSYWNFGDASPSATTSITSPKHVFTNATIYTVKLLVTNTAGCKDSVYKPVTVNNQVKANFTNGPACLNNSTLFQSTSIIPPSGSATYSWAFPGSTATVANPIKTFTNSGVYNVTLIVDGNNGCTSSITKLLNVYLPPIASFSIPSFCAKDTGSVINLSNPQSGIISSYNWRLNNITFSTAQSPTLSLTNPGNNSVRLTIINSFGCKDSTTNSLTIFPLPVVDFSTTPVAFYYLNEPINFTPSITNATSYLWNMNGNSTYTIQSPTEIFNTEGAYNVSLNLKDQNGCKGSKTKNITVNKRYLDLAILNVSTTKDNDGFMTVITDIANYGSVPISSFKMGYQISDGGNIKETWNGTLNPNSFYTFTFNAVSASAQNSENDITCVEIENVNTTIDDNTANNALCNSFNSDNINVSNPLPNPTNGDIILPITLNRDLDYTIAIYNSVGQIQYEETTKKGLEGLNFVTLNTSSYAHGYYIIKTTIDGNIFIKKFIKISYE